MTRKMGRRLTATAGRLAGLASTARRIAGLPLELHATPAYRWIHYFAMGEFFARRHQHGRREEAEDQYRIQYYTDFLVWPPNWRYPMRAMSPGPRALPGTSGSVEV